MFEKNFTAKTGNTKRNHCKTGRGITMKKEKDSEPKVCDFPRSRCRAFCPRCEKPVDLMSFDESAEFYKTNVGSIEALAESGDLHRVHNRKGKVLICCESLFKEFDNRQTQRLDKKMLPRLI